jgi:hypothetical protein
LPEFWKCHESLPANVRVLAGAKFALFQSEPFHPSLPLKQKGEIWTVDIGRSYRAISAEAWMIVVSNHASPFQSGRRNAQRRSGRSGPTRWTRSIPGHSGSCGVFAGVTSEQYRLVLRY